MGAWTFADLKVDAGAAPGAFAYWRGRIPAGARGQERDAMCVADAAAPRSALHLRSRLFVDQFALCRRWERRSGHGDSDHKSRAPARRADPPAPQVVAFRPKDELTPATRRILPRTGRVLSRDKTPPSVGSVSGHPAQGVSSHAKHRSFAREDATSRGEDGCSLCKSSVPWRKSGMKSRLDRPLRVRRADGKSRFDRPPPVRGGNSAADDGPRVPPQEQPPRPPKPKPAAPPRCPATRS
jgi:hypothetical protein